MKKAVVFITVKNVSSTIEECLKSVLDLNFPKKDFDVLVIDAFSTDGTWEKIKKFKTIKFMQYAGTAPETYNHALKKGLLDNYEFVAFTDGDCTVHKDWLINLITGFSEGVGATGGRCITASKSNLFQRLVGYDLDYRFETMADGLNVSRLPTMNLCVRTEVLKALNGFNDGFVVGYDTDFGYRLRMKGFKLIYIKKAVVYHYHRSDMISFAKQKFKTASFVPLLYILYPSELRGDEINPKAMFLQPLFFGLALISIFYLPAFLLFFTLFLIVSLKQVVQIYLTFKKPTVFLLILLYLYRTQITVVGLIYGVYKLLVRGI